MRHEAAPLLEVRGLTVSFPTSAETVEAVRDVDLTIASGETLGLIGETGSGKSAVAMAIVRLLPRLARTAGRIVFAGQDLLALDARAMKALRGRAIALIPQNPSAALNPTTRIGRQLDQAIAAHGRLSRKQRIWRGDALLAQVGFPEADTIRRRFPHQLSGGMRQRILTALGIAGDARLIIADEPTKGLDAILRRQVIATLRALREQTGASLLLITHDLDVAQALCDRVGVMQAGRIVEMGDTRAVFAGARHEMTRRLIASWPANLPPRRASLSGEDRPIIAAHDVGLTYGARNPFRPNAAAVSDASLALYPGETLALVGASGSGKSTLGRILARLLRPHTGWVDLDGHDAAPVPVRDYGRAVQILFQQPEASFDPQHTLFSSLAEPLLLHRLASGSAARLHIEAITRELGLDAALLARYPHQLSGGQLQRMALARVLTLSPRAIILDEPTSMLDVSTQAQVVALLTRLQRRRNLAYLFITHDLDLATHVADRIAIMHGGRIIEQGSAASIRTTPRHPYTRELISAFSAVQDERAPEAANVV